MTQPRRRSVNRPNPGKPQISIITPSLNQDEFLERAICSVLDQGYQELQYIVIDGGSTDRSAEILDLYRPELAAAVIEKDLGESDAINKGLMHASGQIVGFLSSDDLYLPGTLDQVSRLMAAPAGPAWVVGQSVRIGPGDQRLGSVAASAPASLAAYLRHDSGVLPLGSTFIRRDLFDRFGTFDASLHFAFDYEFWCRLLAAGHRPTILNQTLSATREHAASKSATTTLRQGLEYIEAAARHAGSLSILDQYALWANRDQRRRIYALAEAEVVGRDARRFMWRELVRRPWWLADDAVRNALMHGVHHPVAA